ncbi:redox-regulated ATPase YchF [Buchnera aphidicola (Ceratovacuna keduensis)]|uniref:redox-regulated ATPase YchF n=1 Tax=Buchnera aphidicola TaxID=9 RepID=UPI0031B807F2
MSLKCGIVGLPNVGKSMFFNVLTKLNVPSKNFPFCTISPNIGISIVEDERIENILKIIKAKNVVKTFIKFVDIAGLVKNSYLGDGLGNKFLSHIKNVDSILHVVRFFKKKEIIHVNNKIDPIYDVNLVNIELVLSDYSECKKYIKYYEKKKNEKNIDTNNYFLEILNILKICLKKLKKNINIRDIKFNNKQKNILKIFNFITNKPVLYIANIDIKDFIYLKIKNKILFEIKKFPYKIFPICINFYNLKFSEINIKYNILLDFFLKDINNIIYFTYNLLNLQTFFTVGIKEIRSWTIKKGSTAIEAANIIHTDFKKGFIRAEVISYKDFILYKGTKLARKHGKYRLESKNYILSDGDIVNFLFNV